MACLKAINLIRKENTLKVDLNYSNTSDEYSNLTTSMSPEFVISTSTVFQVRVIAAYICSDYDVKTYNLVFIRFVKRYPEDDLTYTMNFTSNKLGVKDKCFNSDDGTWHLVKENNEEQYTIDVTVEMYLATGVSSFSPLHGDMKLMDFELRGENGSVRFHKAVLAASSPVLRRMLEGTWLETTEGRVDVPGISIKTLQHLKDYMYLYTLPDEDLKPLLLLSSYYMMTELAQKCVKKLMYDMTAPNACDLLEFATANKLSMLLLAVLECVENHTVDINKMREHFLRIEKVKIDKYNSCSQFSDDDNEKDDEVN